MKDYNYLARDRRPEPMTSGQSHALALVVGMMIVIVIDLLLAAAGA